jgi:hypothetical protein
MNGAPPDNRQPEWRGGRILDVDVNVTYQRHG